MADHYQRHAIGVQTVTTIDPATNLSEDSKWMAGQAWKTYQQFSNCWLIQYSEPA